MTGATRRCFWLGWATHASLRDQGSGIGDQVSEKYGGAQRRVIQI
jgi:hypothetical protein